MRKMRILDTNASLGRSSVVLPPRWPRRRDVLVAQEIRQKNAPVPIMGMSRRESQRTEEKSFQAEGHSEKKMGKGKDAFTL